MFTLSCLLLVIVDYVFFFFFFFFSSRRRHTRWNCDWSSDVCSSDLVASALPGVPHQLCQFHYLREAGHFIVEADRHAKKELKQQVRGIRPIERQLEGRTDAEAVATRAYCLAVRSALTDDGPAPLDAAGLRLG